MFQSSRSMRSVFIAFILKNLCTMGYEVGKLRDELALELPSDV